MAPNEGEGFYEEKRHDYSYWESLGGSWYRVHKMDFDRSDASPLFLSNFLKTGGVEPIDVGSIVECKDATWLSNLLIAYGTWVSAKF